MALNHMKYCPTFHASNIPYLSEFLILKTFFNHSRNQIWRETHAWRMECQNVCCDNFFLLFVFSFLTASRNVSDLLPIMFKQRQTSIKCTCDMIFVVAPATRDDSFCFCLRKVIDFVTFVEHENVHLHHFCSTTWEYRTCSFEGDSCRKRKEGTRVV